MRSDGRVTRGMRFTYFSFLFLVMTSFVYADANEKSDPGIFSRIKNLIRSISMDNQQCLKKIKNHKGVPTWDTLVCYDIQRYADDSPFLKKNREKIILSDSYGVLATEKVAEIPPCTELRDLNFAILASSPQITYDRIQNLMSRYNRMIQVADEPRKIVLYELLSKELRAVLPLHLKEVCSLGVDKDQVGQIRRTKVDDCQ